MSSWPCPLWWPVRSPSKGPGRRIIVLSNPRSAIAFSVSPFILRYPKRELGLAPLELMSTKHLQPRFFAAAARRTCKSWSISLCFSRDPASLLVVAIPENRAEAPLGSCSSQASMFGVTTLTSFSAFCGKSRRVKDHTLSTLSELRAALKNADPTNPVDPATIKFIEMRQAIKCRRVATE